MKALRIIGAVLVIGVALLFGAAQFGNFSTHGDEPGAGLTLAHKVAVVAAGKMVPADDPLVRQAERFLPIAAERFGNTPEQIADMSAAAANAGKEEGLHMTVLDVMEAATLSELKVDYSRAAASYVTMRRLGGTHTEAIVSMRALAQTFAKAEK